ncbi:MAG: hypothetical protein H7A18_08365 [Sinobacteraceae bacterium]|nr:hypothetical protein [Nevskiaceae bacterium]MCP5360429.1 hypothetical protein [Nevskiaceae bacterium]MCP5472072.1 hypothetical protein [Nevskiaceae bacterium]
MHYDHIPITHRRRLRWPHDKRIALIITVNLETWDLVKDTDRPYCAGGPAILPDVLPGNTADFPNFTWREYGQRVGVFRLFDRFDETNVRPSCTINAVTALRRRPMEEAAMTGKMMNAGLHPHVSGRAYRVRAPREFIRYAQSPPGVWFATREEIASWYLANHATHIPAAPGARP